MSKKTLLIMLGTLVYVYADMPISSLISQRLYWCIRMLQMEIKGYVS